MPQENTSGKEELKKFLCDEAYQKLFFYLSRGEVKEAQDLVEKTVNSELDIGFNINYVYKSCHRNICLEQTALSIALQEAGDLTTANCLIKNGADPNQTLSLIMKRYLPGDEYIAGWLILCSIREEAANKARSDTAKEYGVKVSRIIAAQRTATTAGQKRILSLFSPFYNAAIKELYESTNLEASVNLKNTLKMVLESSMPGEFLVETLLYISKNVNVNSVLYYALKHRPEDDRLTSALTSRGANLNTLLSTVIKEKPNEHKVISTLISKGAEINRALHFAINYHPDNDELMTKLMSEGADVNYLVDSEKNYYILHEAIDKGCSKVVIQCLLERGADPKKRMIVTKGYCEQMVFGFLTLTNPIGWLYLSCLFCARGDSGNPFTKKYVNALELARSKNNPDVANAIEQHLEELNENEKTPLLSKLFDNVPS